MLRRPRHHHLLRLLLRPHPYSTTTTTPPPSHIIYTLKKLQGTPLKALSFFQHATSSLSFTPTLQSYSLLLRSLASDKSHLPHFWSLLHSMSTTHSLSLDPDTYSSLHSLLKSHLKLPHQASCLANFHSHSSKNSTLSSAIHSIMQILLSGTDSAAAELRQLNLCLSESLVCSVLREIKNCPLKGLEFFRWAGAGAGAGEVGNAGEYRHGAVAYNAMARVLGREDCINEFWGLVDEMKGEGMEMDIDTYVKVLRVFTKRGMMGDAVKLYEMMMDGPYKPNLQDCSMILRQISLCVVPDLDLVTRVVDKYESGGHSLTKDVYDGIHRCLTRNGKFEEAEEIVRRMKEAGFEPDNVTYSQLVYGLCQAKRLEDARAVLDEMEEEGCVPDIKTWTILIRGHCAAGEFSTAIGCLTTMIEKGCNADADLLEILVESFCGAGKVDQAYNLAIKMVEVGRVRPWQATCKLLIKESLKGGELGKALKIIVLMKRHKFPPFYEPFPSHIAKFGTVQDALELLKVLTVKNYPSSGVYLGLFKAFFAEGRYTDAQDLLFKCPLHIRKHDEVCKLFGSVKVESNTL